MKNKFRVIVLGVVLLVGCDSNEKVEADIPEGFIVVSETDMEAGNYLYEIKHVETGCHYTVHDGNKSGSIEQMFVEKNSVSVPHCD